VTVGRVAIVGLGLIGGSLGLALKNAQAGPVPSVIGWDQDAAARAGARARGAVDAAPDDLAAAVADADLVVVAVPVLGVRDVFRAIAPALRPSAVVTDVASTKVAVCGWAAEYFPGKFVGGHPMAGSELSGVGNARADLFTGATYCLTPEPATPPSLVETGMAMVNAVGARPLVLDPEAHDRAVAAISHLPFLLSTALVEVASASPEWELFRRLAAGGFRDVSRLASADARMHHDICLTNAQEIRPWIEAATEALQSLARALDDSPALLDRFERAKTIRDAYIAEKSVEPRQPLSGGKQD
jgi:prephenate dehydrogenase